MEGYIPKSVQKFLKTRELARQARQRGECPTIDPNCPNYDSIKKFTDKLRAEENLSEIIEYFIQETREDLAQNSKNKYQNKYCEKYK